MACMATTRDNPYDYFTQFDQWYAYDMEKGYNTCGYLARVARCPGDLSDADYDAAIEQAVDEIVKFSFGAEYIKVTDEAPPGGSQDSIPP